MIYLNNAASSFPKPNQVYEAVIHCMKSCSAGPGRGSGKSSGDTSSYVNRARVLLSELFKIEDPLDIIFTLNDTYALNFAIKGALRPGDHAVISCLEHNSIIRPLMDLARFGITTSIVWTDQLGNIDIENIKKSITPSTRLVAVTYASNVTGSILPVEEIGKLCREHGILYLVDAAQAAGILPIDVQRMNISLLAFPGHKGLFGPMGTGGLYIKKGIGINEIIQGGTGTVSESPVQPGFMPDRFESGTHNVPGLAGLGAGLEFIKMVGIERIRSYEERLTLQFIEGIKEIHNISLYGSDKIGARVSTIAINVGSMPSAEVSSILDTKYHIVTRGGLHCAPFTHKLLGTTAQGAVRFSPGYFNSTRDIEKALKALYSISKQAC